MAVLINDGRKNLRETIHHILDAFGADIDLARGVFIKPNVVFAVGPKSVEITSPKLVKNLILALRERHNNVDIILGEGVAAGCNPEENFRVSGYTDLANELNVPLLDLRVVERQKVDWKFGSLQLPKVALERTYINLPVLKPSSACVISGALKNQKGLLLPAIMKKFHHLGLHERIAELNAVMRPSLTIMDCSRFFGRNVLISGDNCGKIDAAACQLLGIDEPEHVRLSRSGRVFANGFSISGDHVKRRHASHLLVAKQYKRLGRLRIWSNSQACTGARAIFREIKRKIYKPQNIKVALKLLIFSIKGAEVIMGSNPQWRKEYPTVICIGVCTRNVAKENGYIYIPGCPSTIQDLNDNLP